MRVMLLLPVVALLMGCAESKTTSLGRSGGTAPKLIITTQLLAANGASVGTATLMQEADGTRVTASLAGLSPGEYALHLHAVGKCEGPDFKSAGGHFNPGMKQHGHLNPMGEHAGDLPNITIGADGRGSIDALRPGLRMVDGDMPLVDADGAAIVLHAGPDDYRTDPAGNAGARIACGVISHGKPAA